MENPIVVVFILAILLSVVVWTYRDVYVTYRANLAAFQKFKIVEPLMRKLASRETVSDNEILIMAKNPSLRCGTYRVLEAYGHLELFPNEYFTQEKAAESFLVNWLEFPTELGKAPDEIEIVKKIELWSEEDIAYYVFKFRTKAPHWAAQYSWMIGAVGPYRSDTFPYQEPLQIFSRFNPINSISPEMEARWVHDNIPAKSLVLETSARFIGILHGLAWSYGLTLT
jgi:hypothetical protein